MIPTALIASAVADWAIGDLLVAVDISIGN